MRAGKAKVPQPRMVKSVYGAMIQAKLAEQEGAGLSGLVIFELPAAGTRIRARGDHIRVGIAIGLQDLWDANR